ncbi:hypothetical protein [Alienimonas californiensis]|uniref:Uncharacterized protein n=1 Tax=Alienimonas californiensis TaxID=2527989 RepID=A0A517PFH4_9PLAN|nr:hypothetical protein [Alienimonas californiensis]QDT18123.1 hypothetical protein CA12_42630 [Alienimonas californiensis]
MRLTLRTLLAYLDDQLSPSEMQEIGAKLKDAPAARELAERAKETIRRRRLGVPGDPGAGGDAGAPTPDVAALDPNEVAAYLDNALPPERVAAVEQVCLNDDAHLAEVAAGHQILTQVLSEPVAVPPTLASRLAGLAPAAAADPDVAAHPSRPAHQSSPNMAAVPAGPRSEGFEAGLPEHLRKHTRRSWGWVPYAAAALLAAIWLGSLALDEDMLRGWAGGADPANPDATGLPSAAVADAENAAEVDDPAGDAAGEAGDAVDASAARLAAAEAAAAAVVAADTAADEAEAVRLADTMPVDPPPPEAGAGPVAVASSDATMPTADAANANPAAPAAGDAVSGDAVAGDAVAGDAATADAAPGPAVRPSAPLTVADGRGLYALDLERGGFYLVPAGQPVPKGVPLVVPEPLQATVAVEGLPLTIELLGGTRALFDPAQADGALVGLAVVDGRVRLIRGDAATDGNEPAVVLGAGAAKWRLTPQPGATAAIVVEPRRPEGAGADLAGAPQRAALAALGGAVEAVDLAPGSQREPVALPPGSAVAMITEAGQLAAPGAAPALAAGMFVDGLPGWTTGNPPSEAETLLADQFAAALIDGQPLEISLPPLVEDQRELLARQAVAALALAGRAGDLARTLKRTPHPSVVLVAANGLRTLLGRNPEMDAEVRSALDREFPPEARLALGRLLDRLTDAEARDPQVSAVVIDALESSELAVRTLAITELERLTGVTRSYRPLDSASQRESAVKRWRRELDRTDGAILDPNEAAAEPVDAGAEAAETPAAQPGGATRPGNPTGVDFDRLIPGDL